MLKLFYSHEVRFDEGGKLDHDCLQSINRIYRFSMQWYVLVVLAYCFSVSAFGWFYFADYEGDIHWQLPFFLMVLMNGARIFLNVFDSYLDGVQYQELANSIRLVNTLVSAVALWLFIYLDFGLMALALSQLASVISIIVMLCLYQEKTFAYVRSGLPIEYSFRRQFKEIFPLFGKTSLVWFFGYFFWNGFTLVAFRAGGAEFAGRVGLSVSIARGGFDVASSFLNNQRTMFANWVANDQLSKAMSVFKKYFAVSVLVLLGGYGAFFSLYYILPDFYIFEKLVNKEQLAMLFLFYFITLVTSSLNNFVRAYKVEPFVWLSLYGAFMVPFTFWLSLHAGLANVFVMPALVLLLTLVVSLRTFYKRVYRHV
ncbi:hypothetical protein [Agaribacterium haliotis]|uniref:hypothetical protein n=1 Tax=Agaribacterium haliotis TaxID=2013869 RepID=UPI00130479B7|nr:hypothetical protein [Agaribacterium haliotis]